jgi:hypothetical protein
MIMTSKPSAERTTNSLTTREAVSVSVALLGPPLVLIFWAHFVRLGPPETEWPALCIAILVGLTGILAGPWRRRHKAIVGACYVVVAAVALPFLSLLAVCSTGDCL